MNATERKAAVALLTKLFPNGGLTTEEIELFGSSISDHPADIVTQAIRSHRLNATYDRPTFEAIDREIRRLISDRAASDRKKADSRSIAQLRRSLEKNMDQSLGHLSDIAIALHHAPRFVSRTKFSIDISKEVHAEARAKMEFIRNSRIGIITGETIQLLTRDCGVKGDDAARVTDFVLTGSDYGYHDGLRQWLDYLENGVDMPATQTVPASDGSEADKW